MRKVLALLLALAISSSVSALDMDDTQMIIQKSGASMYVENTSGVPMQIIGNNSSNQVSIDEGANGVAYGGDITIAGDAAVDDYLEFDPAASIDTSSANNATITPLASYALIDTYGDAAVATVNLITTANVPIGGILVLQSNLASQDVVFIETGNLDLGGTRTLSDPRDKLMLIKSAADQWDELSFVDNN